MRIPETPPPFNKLTQGIAQQGRFDAVIETQRDHLKAQTYYHWDDLKYRTAPAGLSREEWWASLKFQRIPFITVVETFTTRCAG